jgi:hypothetical protein
MSLWYCHKSNEIIQTFLACDYYDGFQHLSFIIFTNLGFTILKII